MSHVCEGLAWLPVAIYLRLFAKRALAEPSWLGRRAPVFVALWLVAGAVHLGAMLAFVVSIVFGGPRPGGSGLIAFMQAAYWASSAAWFAMTFSLLVLLRQTRRAIAVPEPG